MAKTLQEIYLSRCVKTPDGRPVPHFWQPQPMAGKSYCLFADETRIIRDEYPQVDTTIRRLITLGLELELDVGSFISNQLRKEIPTGPYVNELLKSAIADEARHELGFKYAAQTYGTIDTDKAHKLKLLWYELANKYQPISIAGVLEQQVFLVTLGVMRLVGGPSISELAMRIAEDESRHVATNVSISKWLRVKHGPDVDQAVMDTLEFCLGDLDLPLTGNARLNLAFCANSSKELKETNQAKQLDRLCRVAQHKMPFEIANKALYTTRQTEAGQVVY